MSKLKELEDALVNAVDTLGDATDDTSCLDAEEKAKLVSDVIKARKALAEFKQKNSEIAQIFDQCRSELATNFYCSADQILGVYGAKLGLSSEEMGKLIHKESKQSNKPRRLSADEISDGNIRALNSSSRCEE